MANARDNQPKPVLRFLANARPEAAEGRGATEKQVLGRLETQRAILADQIHELSVERPASIHHGRILVVARMDRNSRSPTYTPTAIVDLAKSSQIVATSTDGYVLELLHDRLAEMEAGIRSARSVRARVAISRVDSLSLFGESDALGGREPAQVWEHAGASAGGRAFFVWLAPFTDGVARSSVVESLHSCVPLDSLKPSTQQRIARYIGMESSEGLSITLQKIDELQSLVASGVCHRIEPLRNFRGARCKSIPDPPVSAIVPGTQPIVGIVDGDVSASRYQAMMAWQGPAHMVAAIDADTAHGNKIASIIVEGKGWNPSLHIPALSCRFGIVRVLGRPNVPRDVPSLNDLTDVLDQAAAAHPDTKVWNFSFNEDTPPVRPDEVSPFGQELAAWARRHGVLPVVSMGNHDPPQPHPRNGVSDWTAPADCEAAITVGGRDCTTDGTPGGPCDVSRSGPGPGGWPKPELSWFSELRLIGGGSPQRGTSYSTALMSVLAAHTFERLSGASPDLVRALLINVSDNPSHDPHIGWGTPRRLEPWSCPEGEATLLWTSELMPGVRYSWDSIPIPPQLLKDGHLVGTVVLTAILTPRPSANGGAAYFTTRIETQLRYSTPNGEEKALFKGTLHRWGPVVHRSQQFKRQAAEGGRFRLSARVFTRDGFQFGYTSGRDFGEQTVTFALSFRDGSSTFDLYNSVVTSLGADVESAVLEVQVEQSVSLT